MRTFDYAATTAKLLTPETVQLISALHECKGKQALYLRATPDVLDALLEIAKIQSAASSNRIEGISTSDARIKALMIGTTAPKNRSEREIAGYRDVLAMIHEAHESIPLRTGVILQLHRDLCRHLGPGAGGSWKNSDNVIAETDKDGRQFVRFHPASAFETPGAMEALCAAANEALDAETFDPLLVTAQFVLDFLCIHPFRDGNGRMSRLLTLLLFYRAGYAAGRYISLEKIIEESKETYYETLQMSSSGWHDGENDPLPFVQYLLGTFLKAYSLFDERTSDVLVAKASKEARIRLLFERTVTPLSRKGIRDACPDISDITVKRTLASLLASGVIRKIGAGRATSYAKT